MKELPPALPFFDSIRHIEDGSPIVSEFITKLSMSKVPDSTLLYEYAIDWLLEQKHSENNYKSYRSELTSFLHWCFTVAECSVSEVTRRTMNHYIDYCCSPPKELVTYRNVAQFKDDKLNGYRVPNPLWKPFLGKKKDGINLPYKISDKALKTKLAILSSFFTFLNNEEYMERNPAMMLMKSGRFKATSQGTVMNEDDEDAKIFTDLQWSYVVSVLETMAEEDPETHERTKFLINLMYSCYLRISEVSARNGFAPMMCQFKQDGKTGVWGFHIPRSKGGKKRTVAVSNQLLKALQDYRRYLNLPELPHRFDETPLFVRHQAASHGRETGIINANLGVRQIRDIIANAFSRAADKAMEDGFYLDAKEMRTMTPHSLRHTGISHDININKRPLPHVQADAGHDSIDTTSKYLHTTRVERHETAANKPLDHI